MEKICVTSSRDYEILIGNDLIKDAGVHISKVMNSCKLCIVTDEVVSGLYKTAVEDSLKSWGFEIFSFVFESGELHKTMDTVGALLEFLAENSFTRSDAVVALGGGITGDLTGFGAASFLRGIRYIQIPTTFLAAVDSSVGGKTGVNLKAGKNLAGAFWQPSLVICDCNTFRTLPFNVFLDGVAETIKYGVITDKELFSIMYNMDFYSEEGFSGKCLDSGTMIDLVKRCVVIKRDIVEKDERDIGIRQLLNFGHTVGHAIEKCSNYEITHGHGVALGMLIVSRAAFKLNLSDENCASSIEHILKKFGFPITCQFTSSQLAEIALKDKKRSGGYITLIIPKKIGKCVLEKIPVAGLETFIGNGL